MKRIFRRIAALVLAAAMLSGCQAAAPAVQSTASASEAGFTPSLDTNASAVIDVRGSWANFEALEAVADDWNEIYPNVTVNYTRVDEYNKHLASILQTDDRPTLVVFGTDAYYTDKDAVEDSLVDLSTIGLDTSAYADGALALGTVDDKLLTLNWGMQAPGYVANTTLLESLGLRVPTTHEEFEQVCAQLKEAGYTPLQGCYINVYSDCLRNDRNLRIAQKPDQQALYEKFSTAEAGCGEFFAPEFEAMLSLLENGDMNHEVNNSIEDIYELAILHFFEGQTPFLCANAETVSGMKKRESKSEAFTAQPFTYEFVSLPVESDTPALSVSALNGLALVEGSADEEWGAEFLRFICSKDELNTMAEVKGVPPLTHDGSADARFAQISTVPADHRVNEGEYPVIALITTPYNDVMWKIATGELTTVEEAEAAFEESLAYWIGQQGA